jgi:sugar/nucleoside kinase (ribokinase family)
MANLSMLTIGDSTVDNFFEVDSDQASVLCNTRSQEKELCFKYGEKVPIKKIRRGFGGSALNTSVGFSRLGIKTAISTIVGEDNEGELIIDFLKKQGLETDFVKQSEETNMSVVLIYNNERTVLSYHRPREYNHLEIPAADNIYFASAGKGAESIIPKLLGRISAGSKLYFNPGSWELLKFENFAPLVKYCQALILNKDEADLCLGEVSTGKQLKAIRRLGAEIAVITAGAEGAYIDNGQGIYHMGIASGQLTDPTGAGDSFSVGLVGGLILGKSLEESCKWGMVNSASVLEKIGANQGLLSHSQLEKELLESANLNLKPLKE